MKSNAIKIYNILLLVLVPLLVIAVASSVVLASMTYKNYGNNKITISSLGATTSTLEITDKIYPMQQINKGFSITNNYASSVTVSLVIDSATITYASGNTYNYYVMDDLAAGNTIVFKKNSTSSNSSVTPTALVSADYTITANNTKYYALCISIPEGNAKNDHRVVNPNNDEPGDAILTTSATKITITYTINVALAA